MRKQRINIKTHGNELILAEQPHHDIFLQFMTSIFRGARWFGVAGSGHIMWQFWGVCVLILLISIECGAIVKVIRALAGWARDTSKQRSVTARLAGAMFYAAALLSQIVCWKLSHQWEGLSKLWASVEWVLSMKYVPQDRTLRRRLIVVTVFIGVSATVEHLMSILATTGLDCPVSDILRTYILKSHGFLVLEQDYHDMIAVPVLFTSNVATVLWNLQDLLIVLISMGLTSRYHRLNLCVATVCAKLNEEKKWSEDADILQVYVWRKIREGYVKQATLVRKLNEALGTLIMFSNFFNFYFICLQLFLGITEGMTGDGFQQVYGLVSLLWVCLRAGCVVLAGADVYEHSRRALPYLYSCHARCYNIEIERLQEQLSKDYVALGGVGFFYLTRTVLLEVASSVLTYVLVLVQYDNSEKSEEETSMNSTLEKNVTT